MERYWQKRIIDKYIIKEVLNPFLVGVGIVSVIMISSYLFQLTDYIIIKKIPISLVIRILLYKLPQVIVQTFPISILFATISGMGRLNRENEFTALRMGGVSLYRLVLPLVILGLLVSCTTYFINEEVVPWSNHEANNIIRRYIFKETMPHIKESTFFKGPEGRIFYVDKYDANTNILHNILIYNFPDEDNGFPEIVTAKVGKVVGEEKKWRLEGGIIHQYTENGHLTTETQFEVMEYQIVRDSARFFGEQRTTSEMSREQLKENIDLFSRSGVDVTSMLIEYHLKLSMPFAALIFILVGTPLSLSSKDSRAVSIIFTIVVVFSYYLVLSLAQSFGKNGALPPLIAAWLPNFLFGILGIILLIWRETWQNWIDRLFAIFTPIFLLALFLFPYQAEAEDLFKVEQAQKLHYQLEEGLVTLSGDIFGAYNHYHILADKVVIQRGENKNTTKPASIQVTQGKMSGCDLEKPHYYFHAKELIIYPEDHLIAKQVTFWELKGRLPLFYWPYLYISLKDRTQKIVPEFGYHSTRGWFVKTTYNYWYDNELPGKLLLDYYTISGFAGGFKQYFFYEDDLKGSLYFFSQENRTDIPGLFDWEGAFELNDQRGEWKTDTNLEYTVYDNYTYQRGRFNLSNQSNRQYLSFTSSFKNKDYLASDTDDDRELDLDLTYRLDLPLEWKLNLNYNQDYLYNKEDGLKRRWGSKSYLSRDFGKLDLEVALERYAPRFTEEDDEEEKVSYYSWPEIDINYKPGGDFAYQLTAGRYYEDASKMEGYRGAGGVNYDHTWRLSNKITLSSDHNLQGKVYRVVDFGEEEGMKEEFYLISLNNKVNLKARLTQGLIWNNTYSYLDYYGETPFKFDRIWTKEEISSNLNYRRENLNINLKGGYDIYNEDFSPLRGTLKWKIVPSWSIETGTYYNIDDNSFGDLALTSKYENDKWQINTGIKYDLMDRYLKEFDNQLIYKLEDEWYFETNSAYENDEGDFTTLEFLLKKNFHCRQLWFTYDHIKREFTVEYRLNLFPDEGIKIGTSKAEPFMFDFGIEDILGM